MKNRRDHHGTEIHPHIRRHPWEVEPRLKELGLTAIGLRRVRDVARAARNNATAFHAANAAGTYSYQDGVWCLRDEFVGDDWRPERPGGVEAIFSTKALVRVAFANVDRACDDGHSPQSISDKGSGAQSLASGNLFGTLPTFAKEQSSIGVPLLYFMVDGDGRAELSRPTIAGGSFGPCVERNYISFGEDDDSGSRITRIGDEQSAVEASPTISRKSA